MVARLLARGGTTTRSARNESGKLSTRWPSIVAANVWCVMGGHVDDGLGRLMAGGTGHLLVAIPPFRGIGKQVLLRRLDQLQAREGVAFGGNRGDAVDALEHLLPVGEQKVGEQDGRGGMRCVLHRGNPVGTQR